VTAPLVVVATARILTGQSRAGVASAGARFEPRTFLGSLTPEHLSFTDGAATGPYR
jgi:hypothetical protein